MSSNILIINQGITSPPTTREQVLNYRASFCSHYDSFGNVVFDPAYSNASDKLRKDWLKCKQSMGVTHMILCPVNYYPDYDHVVKGFDFQSPTDLIIKFLPCVDELLNKGIIPHIKITNGDPQDQSRVNDGRFKQTCKILKEAGYSKHVVWDSGWENFGYNPSWSTRNLTTAFNHMVDAFGGDLVMMAHLNSNGDGRCTWASANPYQQDDPTKGDEIGAHYTEGGIYVSLFGYQTTIDNPYTPPFNYKDWYGVKPQDPKGSISRWVECLERFVPVGTYIPAANYTTKGPFWFTQSRPNGPEKMVMLEPGVPFYFLRNQIGSYTVEEVCKLFNDYNVMQGCWVPI